MKLGQADSLQHSATAKYCAEFVGTFFLVFTVGCSLQTGSLGAALSIGAILMAMVYALGSVSGAHFNPAVTLAVALSGRDKIEPFEAFFYMVAQVAGGIAGALMYLVVVGGTFLIRPVGVYSVGQAAALEIFFAAALCYVVLNVATAELPAATAPNGFFGMAIGFTVVAAAITIGPVSGCSLNPAVSLGAIAAASIQFGPAVALRFWAPFVFAPFAGAFLGVIGFYFVRGGCTDNGFEYRYKPVPLHDEEMQPEPKEYAFVAPAPVIRVVEPPASPVVEPRPVVAPPPVAAPPLVMEPPQVVAAPPPSSDYPTMTHRASLQLRKTDSAYFNDEYDANQMFCGIKWQVGAHSEGVDIDLSVVKFRRRDRKYQGVVYFGNDRDKLNCISHSGDELTGSLSELGEGDTERVSFKTGSIQPNVDVLIFVITIFSSGVNDFRDVNNFSCRVVDSDSNKELCVYKREDIPSGNALVVATMYRKGSRWVFKAIDEAFDSGEHATARNLAEKGSFNQYVDMAIADNNL